MVCRHATDGFVVCRECHRSGKVVREVTRHASPVVSGISHAVVYLRRRSVTIVVGWFVLVAGEDFVSVYVRVEIAVMLGISVSQSCGRQSLSVVVDDH